MSKKKQLVAIFSVLFIVSYIFITSYLPVSVVEDNDAYSYMFYIKTAFIALSISLILSAAIFTVLHRAFIMPYLGNLKRFQPLLWQLVKRDFITRYKRSVLGVLWSLLSPLLTMLVMTLVFSHLFRGDIPYFPVYLLGGQIIFGFFTEATNSAMGSVIGGASMIKKVYVPKYIFPVSKVLSSLVNLCFSFLAFLLVFVFTGAPWNWTFLLFPIPMLYTFVFSLGVGMFLSSVVVFFRDITYIYGIFLTALTYFTPLFYPVTILPDGVRQAMGFNPLYHFVDYFRSVTLYGTVPGLWENIVCVSFALCALFVGVGAFQSQQDKYILHL
ncbi:ABC transporter permease [Ruminococcaceae bacterium OttesenSCG-928-L11]|nr:ABC transporter permease [Ruminococcaceae bacterium OttesenSCG-928-L11]